MRIAIVGAGFAGLTTARHLKQFGHDAVVFEKTPDVGGVWSTTRLYPGVSTQNNKQTYHLSELKMPRSYPQWPSGRQVQQYLHSYVEKFDLLDNISCSTEVVRATLDEAKKEWTITLRDLRAQPDREMITEKFDYFVVCNGIFSSPMVPKFPGNEQFVAAGGTICHTSEYLNLEDARNKNIVVVGYGKSSCDIAVGLCDVAKSTTVVARELIWKVPKYLGGVLNFKVLLLTRLGEALFPYIERRGVERFLHGAGRPIRNSMIGSVQSVISSQLKLKKIGLLPRGPFERIARSTVSLVTDGFFDKVRSGRIAVKRDTEITQLSVQNGRKYAHLANGDLIETDAVICGTGWNQDVPFLDTSLKARLFDNRGNFQLYRQILPPKIPCLAFNGYNSSFFSPLSAEMGALWIASHLMNDLKLPAPDVQLAQIDTRLRWMEERTEGQHAKGTNIIPFSMHQIDEILADMKFKVGPIRRFMEWQLPVAPSYYTRFSKKLLKRSKRLRPKVA